MSVASVLARGRAAAEALMVDTCTVKATTGETTDPNTGVVTPTYSTVYTGRCRFQQQQRGGQSRAEDAGEAYVLMVRRELQLPVMTSTGIRAGQLVTCTACDNDPDLIGKTFIVRDESGKTHATARRLGIEEATG